jgi:L-2-hydroxyglutarate oxidase LhgO
MVMRDIPQVDTVVIGGGVVGAAVAMILTLQKKGDVVLLERHSKVAEGVTSRNSGVIHSGLYYPPASLKAELCLRGQALLYEFLDTHHVPYKKTGKLVIAVDSEEIQDLHELFENAKKISFFGKKLYLLNTEKELTEVEFSF